jgi:hypothetical protein
VKEKIGEVAHLPKLQRGESDERTEDRVRKKVGEIEEVLGQ